MLGKACSMNENLRGLPWFLPAKFGAVNWNRPRRAPAFFFPVSIILSCISLLWEASSSSSSQKFPAFCRNERFSTVLTRFRHFRLTWARSAPSTPPHSIFKIQFNIIPPTHMSFKWSLFLHVSAFKSSMHFSSLPSRAMFHDHLIFHVFKNCSFESAVIQTPLWMEMEKRFPVTRVPYKYANGTQWRGKKIWMLGWILS